MFYKYTSTPMKVTNFFYRGPHVILINCKIYKKTTCPHLEKIFSVILIIKLILFYKLVISKTTLLQKHILFC